MPPKIKEEERIERIIRGLLKLPENRRCINCNSLGPQYVCTTFWTFICTNCSGVHREFTHRVKSVSMAKFSAEEVSALQAGGNERAREIYFKTWDPNRNFYPDGSNLHKIRDLIKRVYLDRRYSGARTNDKLSQIKAGGRDDYHHRPSFEASRYSGGREGFFESRSFRGSDHARRDDFFERHSFENSTPTRGNDDRNLRYFSDERNSPHYRQDRLRPGTHSARVTRFEVVDDRFREDSFGGVRRYGVHRYADEDSRARSSSPVSDKNRDKTSRPALRPLIDILGEKTPPLKVGESQKTSKVDASAQAKKAGNSYNPPSEKKEEETKTVTTFSSLIDWDDDPGTTGNLAVVQTEQKASLGDDGSSSVPSGRTENVSNNASDNSLENLLFGLAVPAGETSSVVATSGSTPANIGIDSSHMENAIVVSSKPSTTQANITNQHQSGEMQLSLLSTVPVDDSSCTAQQSNYNPPEAPSNQSLNLESTHVNGPQTNASSEQSLQVASMAAAQGSTSVNESVPRGRQELPADLFGPSYSPFATAAPAWQSSPAYGMGYNTQYHPVMPIGAPPDSVKSTNPFDIGDNGPHPQATMQFPSMSHVQGTVPNSSLSPGLQSQGSAYASPTPPQGPYGMMIHPGAYMGLQPPNNMHSSRPQGGGVNSFGSNDPFASLNNPIHQQHSASGGNQHQQHQQAISGVNPYSSTGSGNPFG